MCWVMPPASPLTTLVLRMASSSEVLPWSTWPMMVTTGGRGSRCSSASVWPMKPSSTSASDTRLGVWPNSVTISSAVSASITSLILCISPCAISSLMTSTDRSVMRLASSWMVITSGMITSRITLSRGCCTPAWRSFSRSRLRRSEASERSRCASSKALLMVSLMRSRLVVGDLDRALDGLGALLLAARIVLDLGLDLGCAAGAARHLLGPAHRVAGLGLLGPCAAWPRRPSSAAPRPCRLRPWRPPPAPAPAWPQARVRASARPWDAAPRGVRARARPPRHAPSRPPAHDGARRVRRSRARRSWLARLRTTSATVPRSAGLHRFQDLAVLRLAGRRQLARLLLLDDHRLRAAVAEALADVAGFDRPLQAQRLASAAPQRLIGGFLRL